MSDPYRLTSSILEADAIVVGAGFGGVSTALHLALAGAGKVVLLEKERDPGRHSSGLNAGMVRQIISEESVSALARSGAAYIRERAEAAASSGESPFFRPTGSLLLASGEKASQLERDMASARAAGIPVERWDAATVRRRFPVLGSLDCDVACFSPGDGVVDLPGLLGHYVREARAAGVTVVLGTTVTEALREGDRVSGVLAGSLELRAPILVNAGGPWALDVGRLAGAMPLLLRPRRRHIFVSKPIPWVPSDWPFIWDISADLYFRPEAGGLLFSPCDESPPLDRESSAVEPGIWEMLQEKLQARFPRLACLPVERGWSGLRTLTPDGRFAIGPDPRVRGFFWVAGLGGHGVTSSFALGRLAAEVILHPGRFGDNPHDPARLEDPEA